MSFNVAIDGPAGAGKSTVARAVAKEMGLIYVDTGAMYRAMALFMLREGVDLKDSGKIVEKCVQADITIRYEDGIQVVYLNGENVNPYLRTEEVGEAASVTSGTCVLPGAQLKIYLTAGSDVRAKRRYDELTAKGESCNLADIKADIEERDYRDIHREMSPLRQAEDAVLVDTSDMTQDEVINEVLKLCRQAKE